VDLRAVINGVLTFSEPLNIAGAGAMFRERGLAALLYLDLVVQKPRGLPAHRIWRARARKMGRR
jgi:hypothetical protein